MWKKLYHFIFLFVFLSSSHALSYFDAIQRRDSIQQLKIGALFPDFSLKNTNGNIFTQKDLKEKITVINFWFESCVPCIRELDALNRLYQIFKDNPDSLEPVKPRTLGDLYRMGIMKKEKDTITIIGRKYMDFKATTLAGKIISQKQLPGKVTVIDIWEHNCAPCMAELEFFNKLYLDYTDNPDFQLFTFTSDTEEDAKEVVKEQNLLYDVACVDRKECYRLNYNSAFPTIIIIDKHGIVSYYKDGGYTEREKVAEYFKELGNQIDNLLKNK